MKQLGYVTIRRTHLLAHRAELPTITRLAFLSEIAELKDCYPDHNLFHLPAYNKTKVLMKSYIVSIGGLFTIGLIAMSFTFPKL